jgi:hypothetical protein
MMQIHNSRKGTAPPLPVNVFDHRGELRDAIDGKASKYYEKDGRPTGLLIYMDGVFHPSHMPQEWARTILEEKGPKERWIGILVYDSVANLVVASWSSRSFMRPISEWQTPEVGCSRRSP